MVHPSLLACLKSSWSNAEDIRSISAREMPRLAASRRHGATPLATSAVTVLARSDFRLKYSATLRARSREAVLSSRSMLVVSTRGLSSTGTGFRS